MSTSSEEVWDERDQLDTRTIRFVEHLLYDYKTFDSAIRSIELELEDIYPGHSRSFVVTAGLPSHAPGDTSEPERWGIERAEGRKALRLRRLLRDKLRWKAGVEEALRLASDQGRRIYELRYAEERQHHQVMRILGLPRMTYFRAHREFVSLAAKCLGQA